MVADKLIAEIEKELTRRGWLKTDFCNHLNIGTQTYNNWRTRGVPARRVGDVADLFGWDINKLRKGEIGIQEEATTYSAQPLSESNLLILIDNYKLLTPERRAQLREISAQMVTDQVFEEDQKQKLETHKKTG